MPLRLRPTAPLAADAILVGDPGRALLLAQELLAEPRMSNHARGLWGYSGETPAGRALTVQSTGMGGPSAAVVLADLAELGLRRAIRVGSCTALAPGPKPGELLVPLEASAWLRRAQIETFLPDARLTGLLRAELGPPTQARPALLASLDEPHDHGAPGGHADADAADMQTATLFERAASLGVAMAAVLIVAEDARGTGAEDEAMEAGAKRGGRAAAAALGLAET